MATVCGVASTIVDQASISERRCLSTVGLLCDVSDDAELVSLPVNVERACSEPVAREVVRASKQWIGEAHCCFSMAMHSSCAGTLP